MFTYYFTNPSSGLTEHNIESCVYLCFFGRPKHVSNTHVDLTNSLFPAIRFGDVWLEKKNLCLRKLSICHLFLFKRKEQRCFFVFTFEFLVSTKRFFLSESVTVSWRQPLKYSLNSMLEIFTKTGYPKIDSVDS